MRWRGAGSRRCSRTAPGVTVRGLVTLARAAYLRTTDTERTVRALFGSRVHVPDLEDAELT